MDVVRKKDQEGETGRRYTRKTMGARLAELQPVMAFVTAHLADDVSLGALAGRAGFSPFHLQRMFAATVGESPKQLALRLRLARAAVLLLTARDSVLDIALECGFQSHEVFCRAFRRRFGLAPKAYRDRGFMQPVSSADAQRHAALVGQIGPCIGLYRTSRQNSSTEMTMPYTVTRTTLTPQPVLIVRRKVKATEIAATIGEVLPRIFQHAQERGIALAGHPFTRYIDIGPGMLTIEPGMRIAGAAPSEPAKGAGDVEQTTLPGGLAAITLHTGPYEKLTDAYAALQQWMDAEQACPAGPPWESYITDPAEYPDQNDWKTEVVWPLAT